MGRAVLVVLALGQSRPWSQLGQRSQARLLLSALGSMGKWFTGAPYRVGRGGEGRVVGSPYCTLTCRRQKRCPACELRSNGAAEATRWLVARAS